MDDRTGVIDTVNRYARALDTRDWALLDEVFTPDAVFEHAAGRIEGREAVRGMLRRTLGGGGRSQHLLAGHRVEVLGDVARCVCQVRALSAGSGPAAGSSYELLGEYRDQLVRAPEGWRIARRELRIHREIGAREVLRP